MCVCGVVGVGIEDRKVSVERLGVGHSVVKDVRWDGDA